MLNIGLLLKVCYIKQCTFVSFNIKYMIDVNYPGLKLTVRYDNLELITQWN